MRILSYWSMSFQNPFWFVKITLKLINFLITIKLNIMVKNFKIDYRNQYWNEVRKLGIAANSLSHFIDSMNLSCLLFLNMITSVSLLICLLFTSCCSVRSLWKTWNWNKIVLQLSFCYSCMLSFWELFFKYFWVFIMFPVLFRCLIHNPLFLSLIPFLF